MQHNKLPIEYVNFINECKNKNYTGSIHRHHILPKFMGGKDISENIVKLSYKDHLNSHLILAKCYDKTTNLYKKNIFAANMLTKWVESPVDLKQWLSEIAKERSAGQNNPFYGKKHSEETKQKISNSRRGKLTGPDNPNYGGKSVTDITRSKLSLHATNRIVSDLTRQKIGKFNKGKKLSVETKMKMSISKTKPKVLIEGVYHDLNLNQYYRICKCAEKMTYAKLCYANDAQIKNSFCKSCRHIGRPSPNKGKILGPRKYKVKQPNRNMVGSNNPNSKKVINIIDNRIFNTRKEYLEYYNISGTLFNKHIKLGHCNYLEKGIGR
jgi:hypothetical protein